MNFILYSHIDQASIDRSLGLPEYSYYFVLKEFRQALELLGPVHLVQDPAVEVDALYDEFHAQGQPAVFISFSPPNKAPVGLRCPSLCVFAWEFDTIPNESWDDDPRNDWRTVLQEYGRAISLSTDSAEAVRRSMGEAFKVAPIPVPVWDRFSRVYNEKQAEPVIPPTTITVAGNLVDSNLYTFSNALIELEQPERCFSMPAWNGEPVAMDFREHQGEPGYLVGFYGPEPWGSWSKVEEPWILLPMHLEGEFIVSLRLCGFGANVNRNITVKIGDASRTIAPTAGFNTVDIPFKVRRPGTRIRFLGLDLTASPLASDPRTMGLGLKSMEIRRATEDDRELVAQTPVGDYENGMHFEFNEALPTDCQLLGFYMGEPWGVWSRSDRPWISLPHDVEGKVTLQFSARGYGHNIKKPIGVRLGNQVHQIKLRAKPATFTLHYELDEPADAISFEGIDTQPVKGAADDRTMGIGLSFVDVKYGPAAVAEQVAPAANDLTTEISGVVYASVFNPGDDRKNWMDMLTAFVFAFRDRPDATLLLKMTHNSIASYLGTFHYMLQRMAPFKCRVLIVHGYLEEQAYEDLIKSSSYYVNTSHCEGLCLPLMEFMACGKPGIVPPHTAMRDYVTAESSFLVRCGIEPSIWPHDPRDVFRAYRYRLEWWSLVECYRESYQVAKEDSDRYQSMAQQGIKQIREFCSQGRVAQLLGDFLECADGSVTA